MSAADRFGNHLEADPTPAPSDRLTVEKAVDGLERAGTVCPMAQVRRSRRGLAFLPTLFALLLLIGHTSAVADDGQDIQHVAAREARAVQSEQFRISGRVTDSDGNGGRTQVSLNYLPSGGLSGGATTFTQADGSFRFVVRSSPKFWMRTGSDSTYVY